MDFCMLNYFIQLKISKSCFRIMLKYEYPFLGFSKVSKGYQSLFYKMTSSRKFLFAKIFQRFYQSFLLCFYFVKCMPIFV